MNKLFWLLFYSYYSCIQLHSFSWEKYITIWNFAVSIFSCEPKEDKNVVIFYSINSVIYFKRGRGFTDPLDFMVTEISENCNEESNSKCMIYYNDKPRWWYNHSDPAYFYFSYRETKQNHYGQYCFCIWPWVKDEKVIFKE